MRILVVSGFLGAGKTTFIQELARRSGQDFVVYENEYGQADIDAQVLAQTEELSVWESAENCICCTGKQDFATSVLTISNTLDPAYLVVEPTGVARLSSVLENVRQVSYERISLLEPLAIVDATAWVRQRERFADIYLDQVKTASVVVVSKSQLAGVGELEELVAWIQDVHPKAQIEARPWSELPDAWFSELLEHALDGSTPALPGASSAADDEFESLSLAGIELPTETHLIWLLDALAAGVFGEIVRAKGHLRCGAQWLRFDMVDRMWSITGADPAECAEPDEEPQGLGVFIGPSIHRPWLREAFLPLIREAIAAGNVRAALNEESDIQKSGSHGHECGDECGGEHSHECGDEHCHDHECDDECGYDHECDGECEHSIDSIHD
ncbi:GTP-binding protein [Collinsella sp. AGMB00827]|uniref:GTP-binding protein n=1 Tax=Collinsella ureilytica TaxID=2869515 RepID=A0ABS7MLJ6_9ACTN|nr:GTP-binding protein [Collinsella urealyticum]MBY4798241.1 GTP-binding protein [Collinsella urealyticum]